MGSPLLRMGRQADMATLTGALSQTIRCECPQQDMATLLEVSSFASTLECLLSLFYCQDRIKHFTQTHAHLSEAYSETFTSKCYLNLYVPSDGQAVSWEESRAITQTMNITDTITRTWRCNETAANVRGRTQC